MALFQPLVKNMSKQHVSSDGLPIYRRLEADDQDSVRLLTVEDLIVIAKQLTPAEVKEQLLKQIRRSIGDKSWRVRYMAASHFHEVRWTVNCSRGASHLPLCLACGGCWFGACPRRTHQPVCPAVEGQRGRSSNRSFRSNTWFEP
jgi:hypothetical protein